MIGPVQSHYHEGSPVGKRSLRWEGFVENVDKSGQVPWSWRQSRGRSIKLGRICSTGSFFSLEWKSEGVMDDESGDKW